jgi:hypothetical protein
MGVVETNTHAVVLAGGATLQFVVPTSASEAAPETLPEFQVSGLPGARVALRRGFLDAASANVHVACVEAPSDRWAPGMEDIVFGVANGVAHRAMSQRLTLETWEPGALVSKDEHFEQKISGKGLHEGSAVKLSGQHVLGFEGANRDVVLCSVICDEARDQGACAEIVPHAKLEGLVAAPPPSLLVQAVFHAAEKPWNAAALGGVVGMMIVGLVLAKRPRPKP